MRAYMTVEEVAAALDLSKEDTHKLLTKDSLKVPYVWTATGIKVPRKAFYDIWGVGKESEPGEPQEEITMAVFVEKAAEFITAAQELGLNRQQIDKTLEWLTTIGEISTAEAKKERPALYTDDELEKVREYLKDKKQVSASDVFYDGLGNGKEKVLRGNNGQKVKSIMSAVGEFEMYKTRNAVWYRRKAL